MNRQGSKDERIVSEFQKVNAHGFGIVFAGIMVSLIVKLFILRWDMRYWLDTFLILMVACLYITIRSVRAGLYLFPAKQGDVKRFNKRNLLGGLLSSIMYAVLMLSYDLMGSGHTDLTQSILSTLAGAVVFFCGITALQWLMFKRSNKNANKILDQE